MPTSSKHPTKAPASQIKRFIGRTLDLMLDMNCGSVSVDFRAFSKEGDRSGNGERRLSFSIERSAAPAPPADPGPDPE